jgi:hypothetical protein
MLRWRQLKSTWLLPHLMCMLVMVTVSIHFGPRQAPHSEISQAASARHQNGNHTA